MATKLNRKKQDLRRFTTAHNAVAREAKNDHCHFYDIGENSAAIYYRVVIQGSAYAFIIRSKYTILDKRDIWSGASRGWWRVVAADDAHYQGHALYMRDTATFTVPDCEF